MSRAPHTLPFDVSPRPMGFDRFVLGRASRQAGKQAGGQAGRRAQDQSRLLPRGKKVLASSARKAFRRLQGVPKHYRTHSIPSNGANALMNSRAASSLAKASLLKRGCRLIWSSISSKIDICFFFYFILFYFSGLFWKRWRAKTNRSIH